MGKDVLGGSRFTIKKNVLYQDNESAIKIEDNGKTSSGQKTKHMDNKYFWIKDRLQYEVFKVEYLPTENMTADFFTKPLQGALFKIFRDIVLGYKQISTLHENDEDSSYQERVGKYVSKGDVERTDDGPFEVGGTQLRNVKWSDDGPSVVGSTYRDMSYAEVVSKR